LLKQPIYWSELSDLPTNTTAPHPLIDSTLLRPSRRRVSLSRRGVGLLMHRDDPDLGNEVCNGSRSNL